MRESRFGSGGEVGTEEEEEEEEEEMKRSRRRVVEEEDNGEEEVRGGEKMEQSHHENGSEGMKGSSWIGNVYGGVSVCHFISFLPLVCSLGIVFLNSFPSPPYPLKIIIYHSIDAWVKCTALAHDYHYEQTDGPNNTTMRQEGED